MRENTGWHNFDSTFHQLQVVTDHPIHLTGDKRILETVVDSTYKTKSGALNKARALQFCLEEDKNILGDEDWIFYLDEETLLTDGAVCGIMNFINTGKQSFGQGKDILLYLFW